MARYCPYCDARAMRQRPTWYFECDNGHTFHLDDWGVADLREGNTV